MEWHQDSDTVIVPVNTLPLHLPHDNRPSQPECFALFTCLWLVKRHMEPPSAGEAHVRSGVPLGPFIFTEEKTRIRKRTPVHTLAYANHHEHTSILKLMYLRLIKSKIEDCCLGIHPETGQMVGNNHPMSALLALRYLQIDLDSSMQNCGGVSKRVLKCKLNFAPPTTVERPDRTHPCCPKKIIF